MVNIEISGTDIDTDIVSSRSEAMDAERLVRFASFWMRHHIGVDEQNIVSMPDEDDLTVVFDDGYGDEIMFRVLENS